jgi:hypothetical protein
MISVWVILMCVSIISFLMLGFVKDTGGMLGGLEQALWFVVWLVLNLIIWLVYFIIK